LFIKGITDICGDNKINELMINEKMETILLNTHKLARTVFTLLHVRAVTCRDSCTAINTQEGTLMLGDPDCCSFNIQYIIIYPNSDQLLISPYKVAIVKLGIQSGNYILKLIKERKGKLMKERKFKDEMSYFSQLVL